MKLSYLISETRFSETVLFSDKATLPLVISIDSQKTFFLLIISIMILNNINNELSDPPIKPILFISINFNACFLIRLLKILYYQCITRFKV